MKATDQNFPEAPLSTCKLAYWQVRKNVRIHVEYGLHIIRYVELSVWVSYLNCGLVSLLAKYLNRLSPDSLMLFCEVTRSTPFTTDQSSGQGAWERGWYTTRSASVIVTLHLLILFQNWQEGKQVDVTSIVVIELPLIQRR